LGTSVTPTSAAGKCVARERFVTLAKKGRRGAASFAITAEEANGLRQVIANSLKTFDAGHAALADVGATIRQKFLGSGSVRIRHAAFGLATLIRQRILAGMGKFDAQIGWLYAQKAHAEQALADLNGGHHNIEINGEDETQEWVKTYEHLIAKYQSLILAYKARNE